MPNFVLNNPSFALFENFNVLQYDSDYRQCHLVDIPQQYWPSQLSFITQKDSEYFDALNYHLSLMKEHGTLDQIIANYDVKSQVCPEYSGQPLGFGQCFTAFIALIIGNFLGLAILG